LNSAQELAAKRESALDVQHEVGVDRLAELAVYRLQVLAPVPRGLPGRTGLDEVDDPRVLLDQAAAFEPNYYHYYREYAMFLLPKWYGEEGETQAFAEEVSARLPEPDGSIVYFEIASLLACQCDKERDTLDGMSWPKTKQGYSELVRLYGTSNLKANRFAYMSFVADDKASAQSAFAAVGPDWNHLVWRSAANFESAREWATSQ